MQTVKSLKERQRWAKEAARICKLSASARTVLDYLAYRSGGGEGIVYGRTLTQLMVDINVQYRPLAKRTIRAALKKLEGFSLITVTRHGSSASEYIPHFDFTPPPPPPRVAPSATPKWQAERQSEPLRVASVVSGDDHITKTNVDEPSPSPPLPGAGRRGFD